MPDSKPEAPAAVLPPLDVGLTLDSVVRRHVLNILVACAWKKEAAAIYLGVTIKTIYNHMRRYEAEGHIVRTESGWRLAGTEGGK